ncbi:MAG: glycosyl transferase, partial [Microbacterium sp.]|nr:glycosyl transferase [Microbacterium sp.]
GEFFRTAADAGAAVTRAEADPERIADLAARSQERARAAFRWDAVADHYEDLAVRLAHGESIHRTARRARRRADEWDPAAS